MNTYEPENEKGQIRKDCQSKFEAKQSIQSEAEREVRARMGHKRASSATELRDTQH